MRKKAPSIVRIGRIGAGFVAHLHGDAYRQVRGLNVELVSVAATRPAFLTLMYSS